MKILQSPTYNNHISPKYIQKQDKLAEQKNSATTILFTPPSFKALSPKYFKAKQYLSTCNNINAKTSLYDLDLNRLEGIQEGIKVFKGLNMKEIAFYLTSAREFAISRGCRNMCSHCYADARPPIKENSEKINKISWEDFTSITGGIKELNKRLGFMAMSPENEIINDGRNYVTPFHDADSIDLVLKDNLGQEHDFIDISKELLDATGFKVLFDTCGWFPNNKTAQIRAEKYIEYFIKNSNLRDKLGVNISFNPFHSSYTRSLILAKENKVEKANKMRNLYTTRMANVLYTFTPLVGSKNFKLIARSIRDDIKELDGFTEKDLDSLFKETISKLKELYTEDLNTENKYIKTPQDITNKLNEYQKLYKVRNTIDYTEKLLKLSNTENYHLKLTNEDIELANNTVKTMNNPLQAILDCKFCGITDANGDFYLTTYNSTYPTEIKLNLSASGKTTSPIRPNLQEDLPVTKNKINIDIFNKLQQ